jgi:activator of 2-hydroxyglutaryl-CoA dehydratase
VAKFVFSDSLETPIVKHQIGDSAGVIGAALIGV